MWLVIKKIFRTIWNIISGTFYLGWRIREQEKKEREMETSHYFKRRARKEMASWQVREQLRTKKMYKGLFWLPKNFRKKNKGFLFHNYFATVLLNARPQETPESMLTRYWEECAGPYFMVYREALQMMRENVSKAYLEGGHSEEVSERLRRAISIHDSLPNLKVTAEKVMDAHKKIMLEMRKEAERLKEDRKRALDARDKEMLDLDEKILQNKVRQSQERLDGIRKARKVKE